MKVVIINVTGYAGAETARIIQQHPEFEITSITGRSAAGKQLGEIFPHLESVNLRITEEIDGSPDLIISALPHAASAQSIEPFISGGFKTLDLSADFRLKDIPTYEEWYKVEHPNPNLINQSVYGLPELHLKEISASNLIAVPGCYPTSSILGLAPAVESGIITSDIIIDAKSGVSGGGRSLSLSNHYSEVNENVMAYSLDGHRHLPEISQELNQLQEKQSKPLNITFLTHLVPMTRGIMSSCYVPLKETISGKKDIKKIVNEIYQDFYSNSPFTKIVESPPMTKQTLGSNICLVYPTVDLRTNRLIVISCIDNLIKGTAGQAVQSMNIMCGFEETTGLTNLAIYP